MSCLSIWCCQYRHKMLSEVVMGMQFRFFRQHLKAAPAFRISLPSTFTVPVCRLLKDTGMHYFSRLFLWTMWVLQRCDLEQPLVFCISCEQDILPMTTHVEIVALNWTYFLMFSLSDVKPCQSTTGLNRLSTQQANSSIDIKHIQISDLSSAKHLLVLRFSLYLNI